MFAINQFKSLVTQSISNNYRLTQVCWKTYLNVPRQRNPVWFVKKIRAQHDEHITEENQKFIKEAVHEKFGKPVVSKGLVTYEKSSSLLNTQTLPQVEWRKGLCRTGVIARKIGHFPLWSKDGVRIDTTVLQVADNHVIKYYPPNDFNPTQRKHLKRYNRLGCLLVGSEAIDPNLLTAPYMGLFNGSGVMPKKNLSRFIISPEAAILPGTPLNVTHFRVGDHVDVRGKTVDHGFQGVMKRHGFKGQPASHGVTKTHRRPGSLSGGIHHRVWPGKKMPGHMGNRWRTLRGLKIWRINTKTNTMWVSGHAIAGGPNSLVYIYDSLVFPKRVVNPHFPTFAGNEDELPEDIYDDQVHRMTDPTIFYEPEK